MVSKFMWLYDEIMQEVVRLQGCPLSIWSKAPGLSMLETGCWSCTKYYCVLCTLPRCGVWKESFCFFIHSLDCFLSHGFLLCCPGSISLLPRRQAHV